MLYFGDLGDIFDCESATIDYKIHEISILVKSLRSSDMPTEQIIEMLNNLKETIIKQGESDGYKLILYNDEFRFFKN